MNDSHDSNTAEKHSGSHAALVRSILATLVVIIGHLVLARTMESWPAWTLLVSFVFCAALAVVWGIWPKRVVAFLRSTWSIWQRIFPAIGGLSLVALVVIFVYWQSRHEAPKPRIRFTFDTWVGWSPMFVAKEKKFFGLVDVEIIPSHGSGEKRTMVYRGEADAIGETIDMLEFSSSASALAPGVIVWSADRSNGGDAIVASKSVATTRDLVDRSVSVALEVGTPTHYMLLYLLQSAGLPPQRLRLRDLPGPDAAEEFVEGSVEAVGTWYPHLRYALRRPGSHILLSSQEMTGDNSIRDVVAVNPAFLRQHRGAVRDFYIGWCAALSYIDTHPREAKEIMARGLNISLTELESELKTVELPM